MQASLTWLKFHFEDLHYTNAKYFSIRNAQNVMILTSIFTFNSLNTPGRKLSYLILAGVPVLEIRKALV